MWKVFPRIVFLTILATSCSQIHPSYECGRVTPQGDPLVLGGARARHGELPWHVGVYQKTSRPYRQICGGSIVSRKLVISAAHCFWSPAEQLSPASRYAVAAGKIYKPWDEAHDPQSQHSNVSELVIPPLFRGVDRNFAEDLALLVLERPFEYKPYLRPVCLDFDPRLEARQLRPGSKGKVAGWGLTSASGMKTTVLNVIDLPVVTTEECLMKSPKNYWEYITLDKICAGYESGTATLCQGDSGGGLAFPHMSALGVERYFLRGVVSTSPSSSSQCNAFAIASFTRLSAHRDFIQRRYTADAQPLDANSSSASAVLPVTNSSGISLPVAIGTLPSNGTCVLPEHPANGRWEAKWRDQTLPGKPGDRVPAAAQLTYVCDALHQPVGPTIMTICKDGFWKHRAPTCKRQADDWAATGIDLSGGSLQRANSSDVAVPACVLPRYPDHGRWEAEWGGQTLPGEPGDRVVAAQLTYVCDALHQPIGATIVNVCTEGVWQHRAPTCKAVT